jgi:DNA-binding protein
MDKEGPPKNEVRVTMKTRVASYLRYVYHTLEKDEDHYDSVTLKATGRAIARLVPLVELIKRRIQGLYQDNRISSVMVTDKTKMGEDIERRIVMLEIVLSKEELDKSSTGYQDPLPATEVEEYQEVLEDKEEPTRGGRGFRAGFRGGRGAFRGGSRGGFRGGFRGGSRGGRGGFRGAVRGAFRRAFRGRFRGGGGFRGGRFRGGGGYRGERGYRGGFRGGRGRGYRQHHQENYNDYDEY